MSLRDLADLNEAELLEKHGLSYFMNSNSCEVCSNYGDKVCSTCYEAWYCSSEHQMSHMETHRFNCVSPVEVKTTDTFGRYFVASRDLEAGTVILDEAPVFGGPRAEKDNNDFVYCLSCCFQMKTKGRNDFRRCSKCNWPACSSFCEKNPIHSQHECKFFTDNAVKFPTEFDFHVTYTGVFIIRGLFLKENDPTLWSDLCKLDYAAPKLGGISKFSTLSMYKRLLGIPQDFDFGGTEEDWNKIQGICKINAFWAEMDSKCANFIFMKASIFSKSCAPNACWDLLFDTPTSPGPRIRIHTTVRISKGEIVGISYIPENLKKGTQERQSAGFICKCARCIDPRELGTHMSAIKCPRTGCMSGLLLPVKPPALTVKDSMWRCDAKGCGNSVPGEKLMEIVAVMHMGLQNLPLPAVEKYINKELNKVLHPNHWILLEASSRIVLETDIREVNRFTGEELDRYIWHCRQILKVYDIVIPGLSKHRGLILRALGPPLLRKLNQELTQENKSSTLAEALNMYELLKESFLCLKDHQSITPLPPDSYDIRDYTVLLILNNTKEFINALEKVV